MSYFKRLIKMKTLFRVIMLLIPMAIGITGCKDRAAEKRIAELESRLAQLEGNKPGTTTATTTPAATTAATTPEEKPEGPLPVIEFETVDHDFGTVKEGNKATFTYKFKNTGQAPLIIQSAQPSCGCTVPKWSQEPIPVGGTGFVAAEFDTNGKPGINNKTITVTANTWPKVTTLRFKAMVTPKSDGANGPVK
jgi:Protein of unknown function (DUF1573)